MDSLHDNSQNLLELTNQGVWILDSNARTTFVNRRMARMLGYEVGEMQARSLFDFVAPEGRFAIEDRFQNGQIGSPEPQLDVPFTHKLGHDVWTIFEANTIFGAAGEFEGALAMVSDITARKQMEASQRQLATLIQNSSDFIALTSIQGQILFMNAAGMRLVGATSYRVHQLHLHDIVPAGRWHPEMREILACALDGLRWSGEFQFHRLDSPVPVEVEMNVFALFDAEAGTASSIAFVCHEVGRRKRDELARAASERKFRLFFDYNPMPVLVYDVDTLRMRAVNQAALLCYGYTEEEFLKLTLTELRAPRDRRGLDGLQAQLRNKPGETYRQPHIFHHRKDGTELEVETTSHEVNWDGQSARLVVVNDISERKRAERALLETQEQLQLALRSGGVGLWSRDLLTDEVFFSAEWKRQLGYENHEITNENWEWESRVHPDDLPLYRSRLQQYLRRPRSTFSIVTRVRHKDGTYRYLLAQASLVLDEDKRPSRLLGSHVDITERKLVEEQLRSSREHLRALAARAEARIEEERTDIAREVHDQLGQALTALRMDLGALKLRTTLDNQTPLTEPEIRTRIESMTDLIDQTIETARKISRQLRPSVLDDLGLEVALECLADEFQARTGVTVEVVHPSARLDLPRDQATAAYRVAQEALTNVARHAHATHVEIVLRESDRIFVLTVRDDGKGASSAELSGSTSLGILGMHERARLVGGELDLLSNSGDGVTVIFRLPYAKAMSLTPNSVR